MTASGFIALQVHGIGKDKAIDGSQVRWRNLKLTDLTLPANTLTDAEKAAGWRLLWDGKSTDGWRGAKTESFPTKGWKINVAVVDRGGNLMAFLRMPGAFIHSIDIAIDKVLRSASSRSKRSPFTRSSRRCR